MGYEGGSDGGNGGGEGGGAGSGQDITTYDLSSWTLSPGAGGELYTGNCYDGCGGGGGGVLVDQAGPDTNEYTGQGYGGGGNGRNMDECKYGLQGVILLEATSGSHRH